MTDLLWVQTEPKSSVLVDGVAEEYNIADYVSVDDNPKFVQMHNGLMKVFFNKEEGSVVIHGHVRNLDSAERKIPFAFFMKEKNIFFVMTMLKNRLQSISLVPPEDVIDSILNQYVNQKFIPFLTRKKMKLIILAGSLGIIVMIDLLMLGDASKTIDSLKTM